MQVSGEPLTNLLVFMAALNTRFEGVISGWPGRKATVTYITLTKGRAAVIVFEKEAR